MILIDLRQAKKAMKKDRFSVFRKIWAVVFASSMLPLAMAQEDWRNEPIAPKIEAFSPDTFHARKQMLRHDVLMLANDQMEGRLTGSVQDSLAALYIGKRFMENGLLPFSEQWMTAQPGQDQMDYWQTYSFKARWGEQVRTRNVVGVVKGTDSALANRFVVVGAHFDHLGWGDKAETSMRKGVHQIHNGADDNASGVSVMLELMRYYSLYPLRKTLVFVAFSGEEIGLCGSTAFLDNFPFDLSSIDVMFNLDMLGGLQGNGFRVNGVGTSREARAMVEEAQKHTDLELTVSPDGHGPSDHATFYARQIPVFFLCTPPTPTYHTPDDDPGTLNYDGMVRIAALAGNLIKQAGNAEPLHFTSAGEPQRPTKGMGDFKVTLGLMPDINNTAQEGLTAMIVVENKPAYKAGLRSGDVMLSLNGKKISTIEEYMEVLATLKEGMKVKIKAIRKSDGKKKVYVAHV